MVEGKKYKSLLKVEFLQCGGTCRPGTFKADVIVIFQPPPINLARCDDDEQSRHWIEGSHPDITIEDQIHTHDGYEEQFSAVKNWASFEPVFVPVLEHKFLDDGLRVVGELLRNKQIGKNPDSKYGGLIFTSQRAVEAFAKLVDQGKGRSNPDLSSRTPPDYLFR